MKAPVSRPPEFHTVAARMHHVRFSASLFLLVAGCESTDPPRPDDGGTQTGGTGQASGPPLPSPIPYESLGGRARNPIVSHVFTADPSAHVFEERVYVYASHDLDEQMGYDMNDYHVFSSNDLVNWQDHGVAFSAADSPWARKLYAPDCAFSEVTGKYYLYFPNQGSGIGVAVSDDPGGPFVDALGKPLVDGNTPGAEEVDWVFDPMCFVDEDGQAYLYFGGGPDDSGDNARVIRLGEDMTSLADASATTIVAPDFFEAAFVHKYENRYYFTYSTGFSNHAAHIDYMVSDDPMSGFEHAGTVLTNSNTNSNNNNHHSIVEYEGSWYLFYHNRVLSQRDGFSDYQRSIALTPLVYDEQGGIPTLSMGEGQVQQIRNVDAFARIEAETMADQRGVEVGVVGAEPMPNGVALTDLHHGDWVGVSQVDFGSGATKFKARVASASSAGGTIFVFIDGSDMFEDLPGRLLGHCDVLPSGGFQEWREIECDIEAVSGVHDVYLRFGGPTSEDLFHFDSYQFAP